MAVTEDHQRQEAALTWLARTNDPDFDAWDEFSDWLEQEPANSAAYHRLAASEAEMLPLVEAAPASQPAPAKRRWRRAAFAGGLAAIAAAVAAIVVPRSMPVDYRTQPGQMRVIALGGSDQLVMNGETSLQLAGWDRRTVRLQRGQVLLQLRDEGEEKVEVVAGDLRLVDVGTVFEVARYDRATRVLVSEGAVIADPSGARLNLSAGESLYATDGAAVLRATPADLTSVGAFARGQLTYVDEPIDHVVADLRRSTGIDFSANAAIRARRFSGTLSVAEIRRDPRSLEPLLNVAMERSGQGWKLGGRG